ncbi:MAG: hypothetical protein IKO82_05960 [Prevotella sp.]|nr:hypothetical protein [Prevotella sp.]
MSVKSIEESTIVIGVLARDCANSFTNNIARVEELGRLFKDYHVVVYENDSIDSTKVLLQQWSTKNSHVIAICEDLKQVTIPKKSKHMVKPSKSIWRIQKMANFRNRVLAEVRERFSPDYFCFLDIDIESFSPVAVKESIENAPSDWGAICASGHLYFTNSNGSSFPANFQYDAYAFYPEGSEPENMGKRIVSHKWHLVSAWTAEELVRQYEYAPCLSAFNGLAIYKWEAIKNLQYKALQNKELQSIGASICEHMPFHRDIISNGYKVYITRHIEVVYFHKKATLLRLFNNWLNVKLAKLYRSLFFRRYI